MKKVEGVSISGCLYFINYDAFDLLSSYLKSFAGKCGEINESELSEDIESRISEIFNEKIDSRNRIINIEMVRMVISQIGTPSSIDMDFDDSDSTKIPNEKNVSDEFEKVVQGGINIAKSVLTKTTNAMQELSQKIEKNRK